MKNNFMHFFTPSKKKTKLAICFGGHVFGKLFLTNVKIPRKFMSNFFGKIVKSLPPCDPFFLWEKLFFFSNSPKQCRIFFSMKLTVKNFRNCFAMNSLKNNFENYLQSISLKKKFDIFSENSKKNNFSHKQKGGKNQLFFQEYST